MLVLIALSAPTLASLSPNRRVDSDACVGTQSLAADGHGMSFAPATPGGAFPPVDCSAHIEESEEELSDPFLDLISPAFIALDGLHTARSGLLPLISHSWTVALPLRC